MYKSKRDPPRLPELNKKPPSLQETAGKEGEEGEKGEEIRGGGRGEQ